MGQEKRFKKSQWLGIGLILMVLVVGVGESWGQCVPGTQVTYDPGYSWTGQPLVWDDDSSSGRVPINAAPANRPGGWGTIVALTWSVSTGCFSLAAGYDGWINSTNYYVCAMGDTCSPGDTSSFCYKFNIGTTYTSYGSYDYDCDGVLDSTDTCYSSSDADCDGIPDANDPWPNNPAKPSLTDQWEKYTFKHSTLDATFSMWQNNACISAGGMLDECVAYSCSGTDCGSFTNFDPFYNPEDYKVSYVGSNTWTGWFGTGGGPSGADSVGDVGQPVSGTDIAVLNELKEIEKAVTGSKTVLESIYDRQNTQTSSLETALSGQTTTLGGKLDQIKSAVEGIGTPSMSGVESRLDTTNTKLTGIDEKISEVITTIPQVGDTEGVPEGNTSGMEDNSDLTDEALGTVKESLEGDLSTWLDDILYQDNPIANIVNGSYLEYSGASSVSVQVGGSTITLDIAAGEAVFDLIGTFLVGFAGVLGLIEFLRG